MGETTEETCTYCRGVGACPKCWGRSALAASRAREEEMRRELRDAKQMFAAVLAVNGTTRVSVYRILHADELEVTSWDDPATGDRLFVAKPAPPQPREERHDGVPLPKEPHSFVGDSVHCQLLIGDGTWYCDRDRGDPIHAPADAKGTT